MHLINSKQSPLINTHIQVYVRIAHDSTLLSKQTYPLVQYIVPKMATFDAGLHNEQSHMPSICSVTGSRNLTLYTSMMDSTYTLYVLVVFYM